MTRTDSCLKYAIASLLIGVIAIWCVFVTGCSQRDIPTSDPRPPLTVWLPVHGKSMLPTFPNGALAQIRFPVDYDTLKPGQIVVFWAYERGEKKFTFHRLDHKRGDQWVTKGDNPETNARYDSGWLTRDNFYAVATGKHTQTLHAPPPL